LPNALGKETIKGAHRCSRYRELVQQALGKDGDFNEYLLMHSAKELAKRPIGTYCRALVKQTLVKDGAFAECHGGHSAKVLSPSLGTVMVTFLCRVPGGTQQSLC
jgi:hypothetical protein